MAGDPGGDRLTSRRGVRLLLGIWIIVVFVGGAVAAPAVGGGDDLDEAGARRCGERLARLAGFEPLGAAARLDGATWRVSVATGSGVVGILVRDADGVVIDVRLTGPGGSSRLDREARLAVFERGC